MQLQSQSCWQRGGFMKRGGPMLGSSAASDGSAAYGWYMQLRWPVACLCAQKDTMRLSRDMKWPWVYWMQ